jgi:hypothetical protein
MEIKYHCSNFSLCQKQKSTASFISSQTCVVSVSPAALSKSESSLTPKFRVCMNVYTQLRTQFIIFRISARIIQHPD